MKIEIKKQKNIKYTKVDFVKTKAIRFVLENEEEKICFPLPEQGIDFREKIGIIRNIVREAKKFEIVNLEIDCKTLSDILKLNEEKYLQDAKNILEFFIIQLDMANYEFDKYKNKKNQKYFGVENIFFSNLVSENITEKNFTEIYTLAKIQAEEINKCRDISNAPANIINPVTLADYIKGEVKNMKDVKLSVYNEKDLVKIKSGGILAVSAGSEHEPRLVALEYFGNKKDKKTHLCFVGKGVTHDNGGINLKPSSGGSIEEMHLDMSGASAVIHAFFALAKLKVNKNIIAITPLVENSVSGSSYRPGDIITMMSGKTVEVLNTDAEGRIILADALHFAKKYNAEKIIDVATLTGAAIVALGHGASAVMSHKKDFAQEIADIGNNVGDFMWPMPMWNIYKKAVKNKRADIGNIPETNSRAGGSISAGMFLKEFIEDTQDWVHIDMAARMTSTDGDSLASGAIAETMRTLIYLGSK